MTCPRNDSAKQHGDRNHDDHSDRRSTAHDFGNLVA